MSRLILAIAVALVAASPAWAASRNEECAYSQGPDGRHAAYFGWTQGGDVEAVACSGDCEVVLKLPPGGWLAYRWTGPDQLEFADPAAAERSVVARIGALTVYAVPRTALGRRGARTARLKGGTCIEARSLTPAES